MDTQIVPANFYKSLIVSSIQAIWEMVKIFPWWLWVIIAIIILIKIFNNLVLAERSHFSVRGKSDLELFFDNLIYYYFQKPKIIKSGINEIDKMKGKDFEYYLRYLFEKLGYKATRVGTGYYDHRGDFGTDVIAEKGTEKIAIQAKCYSVPVGINAVREIIGGKDKYKCNRAIVITNSEFTNEAKVQAQASGIELWNREKLIEVIASTKN